MIIALEIGLLYAIMALGVYLTYRVLDFPDLTVDGSFTTGGATCAILIVTGAPLWLALAAGVGAGLVAGAITGLLHVWGGINPLLAGILIAVFIPVTEVAAVIFLHEKVSSEKGVALALSLWGLASYSYGEWSQAKAKKEKKSEEDDGEVAQAVP